MNMYWRLRVIMFKIQMLKTSSMGILQRIKPNKHKWKKTWILYTIHQVRCTFKNTNIKHRHWQVTMLTHVNLSNERNQAQATLLGEDYRKGITWRSICKIFHQAMKTTQVSQRALISRRERCLEILHCTINWSILQQEIIPYSILCNHTERVHWKTSWRTQHRKLKEGHCKR